MGEKGSGRKDEPREGKRNTCKGERLQRRYRLSNREVIEQEKRYLMYRKRLKGKHTIPKII